MAFPPTLVNPAVTGSVQISGTVNLTASNVTIQGSQAATANQDAVTHDLKVIIDAGSAVIGHVISDTGSVVNATIGAALPAGTAVIGHVIADAGSHAIIDSGTITTVSALTAITNALPAGTNVIGHVIVDSWSTFTASLANTTTAVTGNQVQAINSPLEWTLINAPAVSTRATVTKAAGAAGTKHVLKSISASVANNGTAAAFNTVYLTVRDGASGVGTVIHRIAVAIPATANTMWNYQLSGLNIVGSDATAMTIEFDAACTNGFETVNITGFDVQ